jgi:putative ABC transport system substrate-binding protein
MRRREFITLMGSAAVWPLIARAQQPDQMRRIGVLMVAENDPQSALRVSTFVRVLEELGWKVGRNVQIDYR